MRLFKSLIKILNRRGPSSNRTYIGQARALCYNLKFLRMIDLTAGL